MDLKGWKDLHRDYLYRSIWVSPGEVPETFSSLNSDALITKPAETQFIVRLERLDSLLAQKRVQFTTLKEQLDIVRSPSPDHAAAHARRFLDDLVEHWNSVVRRDHRPAFAAFLDDLLPDLDSATWPNLLRDRLGLSHYEVPSPDFRLPVALMRYRVSEVLRSDENAGFAVPGVLDSELNSHFFPSPQELSFGRTLSLWPDENCERLVAEILHRRIDYRLDHFYKLGEVTSTLPPYTEGEPFARLRNGHLFCVRYESGREDFGEDIVETGHATR